MPSIDASEVIKFVNEGRLIEMFWPQPSYLPDQVNENSIERWNMIVLNISDVRWFTVDDLAIIIRYVQQMQNEYRRPIDKQILEKCIVAVKPNTTLTKYSNRTLYDYICWVNVPNMSCRNLLWILIMEIVIQRNDSQDRIDDVPIHILKSLCQTGE